MNENLKKKTEEAINRILKDGIATTNLDNLYKLTKINHMVKEEDNMNYGYGNSYGNSYGRYYGNEYGNGIVKLNYQTIQLPVMVKYSFPLKKTTDVISSIDVLNLLIHAHHIHIG